MRTFRLCLPLALTLACASHKASEKPVPVTQALPPQPEITPRPFVKVAPLETILLADASKPIVSLRFVFRAGSVDDPPGKEGLTDLTAAVLEQGGTQELSSAQFLDARTTSTVS